MSKRVLGRVFGCLAAVMVVAGIGYALSRDAPEGGVSGADPAGTIAVLPEKSGNSGSRLPFTNDLLPEEQRDPRFTVTTTGTDLSGEDLADPVEVERNIGQMLYPEDPVGDSGVTHFIGEDLDPEIVARVDDAAPVVEIGEFIDPDDELRDTPEPDREIGLFLDPDAAVLNTAGDLAPAVDIGAPMDP